MSLPGLSNLHEFPKWWMEFVKYVNLLIVSEINKSTQE